MLLKSVPAILAATLSAAAANEVVSDAAPPVECLADVAYDRNLTDWPGYVVTENGDEHCLPFTPTELLPPVDYSGDFYVDEFTDAKVRAAWQDCEAQGEACIEAQRPILESQGRENVFRLTGSIESEGRIDPLADDIDLTTIRRPAFFGRAPYQEAIASTEGRTWTVEVEVPSEANEHEFMQVPEGQIWRLRGWYIEGEGVKAASGETERALIVLVGGRTIETTALQHPDDPLYEMDPGTGSYTPVSYPNDRTEKWGLRSWRSYIFALNEAGFDVLTLDKRGHGISGGLNGSNNVEMSRDIFRSLAALETGNGLRLLSPDGETLSGPAAAGQLLAGQPASEIPLILAGPSQGSMVVAFAMHAAVVGDCSFDAVETVCGEPRDANLRAGMLLAEFAKGPGYAPSRMIREGAFRDVYHIAYLPTSEIMAGVGQWPATFIGRGLWDFSGGLEGTLDLYRRAAEPKELVVVRGPHSENEYGDENVAHMQARMVVFAEAVMRGEQTIPGAARFDDLKELVLTSPPYWEPSNAP